MTESKEIVRVPTTLEQKSSEALAMTQAETARRQQLRRNARKTGEVLPKFEKSPRQITAGRLGMSEATVQRACQAIIALDAADESGDSERATAIREGFAVSINTAARAAAPKPESMQSPDAFTTDHSNTVKLAKALTKRVAVLVSKVNELELAHGGPSSYSCKSRKAVQKLEEPLQEWRETLEEMARNHSGLVPIKIRLKKSGQSFANQLVRLKCRKCRKRKNGTVVRWQEHKTDNEGFIETEVPTIMSLTILAGGREFDRHYRPEINIDVVSSETVEPKHLQGHSPQ